MYYYKNLLKHEHFYTSYFSVTSLFEKIVFYCKIKKVPLIRILPLNCRCVIVNKDIKKITIPK